MRTGKIASWIVAIAACIVLATCGGGKQRPATSYQLPDGSGGQLQHRVEPSIQTADSLDDALAELDALETPEGVDEELWGELKDALEKALEDSCRAAIYGRRNSTREKDGGDESPPYSANDKFVSSPPTGEGNRVTDLIITDNGDGTFTLTWRYRNLGDYNQDGVVGIADITPLAMHYGEEVPTEDTERNSIQAVIDGSGNGRIGIEDITPIAIHFAEEILHYAVEGAPEEAGAYELVSEVTQNAGTGVGRLAYSAVIESPAALWHRVVPVDGEGANGEASNAVLRPSNEPIIYEVSPTEGYQHEEYTFSATVSGAEPLAYAWEFGGGAEPDTSSDPSPTVTLADAGEYSASLTVTNAYDSATYPFTLAVSERDMWAHTWGREGSEGIRSIAVDDNGDVYLAGISSVRCLILKYSSEGSLLWAKLWGGDSGEYFTGVHIAPDGAIYAAGMTTSFGQGYHDVVLVKYDADGTLLWAKTWGTAGYERAFGMDIDDAGNIYVCGQYLVWGGKSDILAVKLSPEGDAIWARTWGGSEYDRARNVLATPNGVYICGYTDSFGAGGNDALLLKYSEEGELEWAMTAGGSDADSAGTIFENNRSIYLVGSTRNWGQGDYDALVLKFDQEANVLWARTWGDAGAEGVGSLVIQGNSIIAVGNTNSYSSGDWDILLVGIGLEGNLLWSKIWSSPNWDTASSMGPDVDGNLYVCGDGVNASGEWMDVEGTVTEPELIIGFPEGTTSTIEGTQTTPEGTEKEPEGVIDTGGGEEDVLLIKNYPR